MALKEGKWKEKGKGTLLAWLATGRHCVADDSSMQLWGKLRIPTGFFIVK